MSKALFTVGVFGLACRYDCRGRYRIKVNVRTDQERQKELAGLPRDAPITIIDMPGGGVSLEDFPDMKAANLLHALEREIREETDGCTIKSLWDFLGPYMVVTNNKDEAKACGDLAFWMPVVLNGKPKPTNEALSHPWIYLEQLMGWTERRFVRTAVELPGHWEEVKIEPKYRPVGKLGMDGRTGRMLQAAFAFFHQHSENPLIFSEGPGLFTPFGLSPDDEYFSEKLAGYCQTDLGMEFNQSKAMEWYEAERDRIDELE